MFKYANPPHTVIKNDEQWTFTNFLYWVLKYIFQLFVTNKLDFITQMKNEIISSFYD